MAYIPQLEQYVAGFLTKPASEIKAELDLEHTDYRAIDLAQLFSDLKYKWKIWGHLIAASNETDPAWAALAAGLKMFIEFVEEKTHSIIDATDPVIRGDLEAVLGGLEVYIPAKYAGQDAVIADILGHLGEIVPRYKTTWTEAGRRWGRTYSEAEIAEAQDRVKLKRDFEAWANTKKLSIDAMETAPTLAQLKAS